MSIWEYGKIKSSVGSQYQISLNEGKTPLEKYTDGSNILLVKREDKNPTGSWKDRGSAYKITTLLQENIQEAVMASSGNAAISMLSYAREIDDFSLHIVVSEQVDSGKKAKLEDLTRDSKHTLYFDKKAKKAAAQIAGKKGIPNIKSSTDESLLKGYWSLGMELAPTIRKYRDKQILLFMAASSGTTAVGTAAGLQLALEESISLPQFHILQTSSCHPLVSSELSERSLADAIVDQSMLRKPQLEKMISETKGSASIVTNTQLEEANSYWLDNHSEKLSYTSLLPIAGYLNRRSEIKDSVCILITSGR